MYTILSQRARTTSWPPLVLGCPKSVSWKACLVRYLPRTFNSTVTDILLHTMGTTGLNPGHGSRRFALARKEKIPGSESTEILLDTSNDLNATYGSSSGASISLNPIETPAEPHGAFPREKLEESFAKIVPSMEDSVSKIEGLLERIGSGLRAFASQEDLVSDGLMMFHQRWVSIAKVSVIAEHP